MTHTFSEVSIQELPAQRVVSCRVVGAEPENESTRMVQNWLVQHGVNPDERRSFGFDVQVSLAEAEAGLRGYEVGYTVPDGVRADDGVQDRIYGGGLYAVLRVNNAFEAPFESIPAGWKHLMQWLENNAEWRCVYNLCYEEVVAGAQGNDLILYHPVVRR